MYKIIIENNSYELEENDILSYLRKENDFNDNPFGMKKDCFIYLLKEYIKENIKYLDEDIIKKNFDKIQNYDLEAINELLETDYELKGKIIIDEELKEEILKDLPSNYSKLEKAMHIYIKMCKILTYDEEYYATNQTGKPQERHSKITNTKNITIKNNEIVCYDFIALYSVFLDELDIKYTVEKIRGSSLVFGDGHVRILFKCDKFLVRADSTKSVLEGDLFYSKFNKNLNGITCKNLNENTKKEFDLILKKVYLNIIKEETKEKDFYPITYYEKIGFFFSKISSLNLKTLDIFSYAYNLQEIMLKNEMNITIVSYNKDNEKEAIPIMIICINIDGINNLNNKYYLFHPKMGIKMIRKENLQQLFDDRTFIYLDTCDEVPKIKGGKYKNYILD